MRNRLLCDFVVILDGREVLFMWQVLKTNLIGAYTPLCLEPSA